MLSGGARAFGYVKISRKAYAEDPWWTERRVFSHWEAWEDCIQMAAWRETRWAYPGGVEELARGEFIASLRFLAERWQWGVQRVRTWLALAQKLARLAPQRETQQGTVYLVVNYDAYQDSAAATNTDTDTPTETAPTQRQHTGNTKRSSKAVKQREQTTSPAFESAWVAYPKRPGNSKAKAWRAWAARLAEGQSEAAMLAGTEAYAAYIRAEGTPPRFVKQAATFYGPDLHFLSDYSLTGGSDPDVCEKTDDFGVMREWRRDPTTGAWLPGKITDPIEVG